mmetsp:Transcript_31467/g.34392  ORF Transcript_31467/g.34392 Transcript_31467/m.34392 type:complete len:814 (+) Transcript_31467:71-2512(+)
MMQEQEEIWLQMFERKIKSKSFEQFSLLMFDFKTAKIEQKQLLHPILFSDHLSSVYWKGYIEYAFQTFKEKKLHLQRLINKALELLEEKKFLCDRSFLAIHLSSIELKSSNEEKAKYFQGILFKRSIGVVFADLFINWSKVAPTFDTSSSNLLSPKQILEKGIELKAEPVSLIREYSSSLFNSDLSTSKVFSQEEAGDAEQTTRVASTSEIKNLMQTVQAQVKVESENPKRVEIEERKRKLESMDNVFNQPVEVGSDNSETSTIKVPTQNVKEIYEAIPKITPKLNQNQNPPVSSGSSKRRKVSFLSSSGSQLTNKTCSSDTPNDNIFLQKEKYFNLNEKTYFKLATIGKGGSSTVFKVISPKDGGIYALKTVDLSKHSSGDEEEIEQVFNSYGNEINLLNKLKHSSSFIIDLIDHQIFVEERKIAMLLELGDIDLAKLLSQSTKGANNGNQSMALDPIFVRMLWKEMLLSVQHIHENRIVHGDLKPANFVFVKGHLKLIDFGIAKSFSVDTTNIYRDSQIGTVNYMAPEAINPTADAVTDANNSAHKRGGMKIGRPSDIWSLGCILYQMIYGRPPFASLNTIQKLVAIPNPNYEILYPSHEDLDAVDSIKCCLVRNPRLRASIIGEGGLLQKPFLRISRNFSSEDRKDDTAILSPIATKLALQEHAKSKLKNNDLQNILGWLDSVDWTSLIPQQKRNSIHEDSRPLLTSIEDQRKENICPQPRTSAGLSKQKLLPVNLKEEIIQSENRLVPLQSKEASTKASKWMKGNVSEANDMKSILEKRMVQMRKFLEVEQENVTSTESLNLSGFYSQL